MPRYFEYHSLPRSLIPCIRPLIPKPHINPLRAAPTPAQALLALPSGTLPPNVRIHATSTSTLASLPTTVRHGGLRGVRDLSVNDDGEVIRQLGKAARRRGGLLWALRER